MSHTSQVHSNDKKYKPALSFYTIVSPSMNPVIKVYDVVVNVRVNNPKDINVGDIIIIFIVYYRLSRNTILYLETIYSAPTTNIHKEQIIIT